MKEQLVWIAQLFNNSSSGWMPEGEQWDLIEQAYREGYDPWETAAALAEGAWPPYCGKGVELNTWQERFLK